MTSVKKASGLKGKYVLVRADFNVPIENGKILDTLRIKASLPTIELLRKKGARIILLSHIGREASESLRPVHAVLKKFVPVTFVSAVVGETVLAAREKMENGDVLLLENLRSESGEKDTDVKMRKAFAGVLATLGDVYVNEAFPVSHREDASIVELAKLLPHYAGLQLEKEVDHLSKVLNPKHPFLFIQGGAKAETKLPLLKRFLKSADAVFVGGELANDFIKASGKSIGASAFDSEIPELKTLVKNKRLMLPETVVVTGSEAAPKTVSVSDIGETDKAVDIGMTDIDKLAAQIEKAKLILWNGPMGWYEGGYTKATEKLLKLIAASKATTIIGGGDTAVLVERKKMADKFTFVSTGGGATLEFLAKGTLPGIKALK